MGQGDDTGTLMEARRTAVEVWPILSNPRLLRIESGVEEGELVVTKGHQHLPEQAAVRITD